MSGSINITYPSDSEVQIKLTYSIVLLDNLQTISCSVAETRFPLWLQMRKFDLLSMKNKNGYTPLFNEVNNSKNMDTSLFIDLAYTGIMRAEKMKVFQAD